MEKLSTKRGLVLEGGAMRGLFSAGVIDVMMERGCRFDLVVGVSAGAAFGCNYKSRQPGRVIRYNKLLAGNWRYCSIWSWLFTGDLFGAEFDYHYVPNHIDIFDRETFNSDPTQFYAVCTDVDTGEPVYKLLDRADDEALEWIRASASMPIAAKIVDINGRKLLDGGIADSIPLKFAIENGCTKNVVVLTRPADYRKCASRATGMMSYWLRRHPRVVEAIKRRPDMYNAQLDFVEQAERRGEALVIRPSEPLPIGHVTKDTKLMEHVYRLGRQAAIDSGIDSYLNK